MCSGHAGTGPDRELLEIGPVDWKGGKLVGAYISYKNLTPKKLKGRGQSLEDPIHLEARKLPMDSTACLCLLSSFNFRCSVPFQALFAVAPSCHAHIHGAASFVSKICSAPARGSGLVMHQFGAVPSSPC